MLNLLCLITYILIKVYFNYLLVALHLKLTIGEYMEIDKLLEEFLFHCQFEKNLNPKTLRVYTIDIEQFKNYKYNSLTSAFPLSGASFAYRNVILISL